MTATSREQQPGTCAAVTDDAHRSPPVIGVPRDALMTYSPVPTYHRLAQQIRELIDRGELRASERLPSEQRIADHLHVSRPTVRHALKVLERDGLVRRVHGNGTFVG